MWTSSIGIKMSEEFRLVGAVCLRQAFDPYWISVLRKGVNRHLASLDRRQTILGQDDRGPTLTMDNNAWSAIPEYEDFLRHSPISGMAGQLMRANEVRHLQDTLLHSVRPNMVSTPWHQDLPYYKIDGTLCSVWIPLQDVCAEDNLAVVSGSHSWGRVFVPSDFAGESERLLRDIEALPAPFETIFNVQDSIQRREIALLSWDTCPGDCIVFDGRTLHGRIASRPCLLTRLTFRFIADDAVFSNDAFPWSDLDLAGEDLKIGERLRGRSFPLLWTSREGLIAASPLESNYPAT